MTQPRRHRTTPAPKHAQERSIDRMVEETFPASDATQLPGRAAGEPGSSRPGQEARHESVPRHATPATIGNQGVAPASRMLEETVELIASDTMTLRFDPELRRLRVQFGEEGLTLDAEALDRLIAILSSKRTLMAA